jgi:tetratricopeptide (TPR) repeat protein
MYLNTKLYARVHELAEQLMKSAQKEDNEAFDALYNELKAICADNEALDTNHPLQWEALADFTPDYHEALGIYKKALALAVEGKERDFVSSIYFSMASLHGELGEKNQALEYLELAETSAKRSADKQLISDIKDLKEFLSED